MIFESWYWKQPLLEMASRLRTLKSVAELTESQYVQIEKDVFIGFYSVRKLLETITKVTDTAKKRKMKVVWHPNKKPVTWRNNHRIDELYDLAVSHTEVRDISFISGRIIHSFVFAPSAAPDGGLAGILFTSDTDKNKKIYSLDIDDIIELFELIGDDYPTSIDWAKDPDTGEETTKVS
jgi:hypothetical protein